MKTALVIGGTGAMGRAVIGELCADAQTEWRIRVVTRDPQSLAAEALRKIVVPRALDVVKGSVDDDAVLAQAFAGATHVFCNTDFFSSLSPVREYEQGLRLLEVARKCDVEMFVYSSLDDAAGLSRGSTPVPHFDGKAAVESYVNLMRSQEFMERRVGFFRSRVAVLVTAPYYENFMSVFLPRQEQLPDGSESMVFRLASGKSPHPMVALSDIGYFAALMLGNPGHWGGRTLELMGDSLTGEQIAATFQQEAKRAARWEDVPLNVVESVDGVGHDLANMHRFFQARRLRERDEALLRSLHPGLLSFRDWLRRTGWRGEAKVVQS